MLGHEAAGSSSSSSPSTRTSRWRSGCFWECGSCRRGDEAEALDVDSEIQKTCEDTPGQPVARLSQMGHTASNKSATPAEARQRSKDASANESTAAGSSEDPAATGAVEGKTALQVSVQGKQKAVRTYINIYKAMRAFQKAVVQQPEPSDLEVTLGVRVEKVYDFYDPVSHTMRVRKMQGDVVHQRNQMALPDSPRGVDPSDSQGAGGTITANSDEFAVTSQVSDASMTPRSVTSQSSVGARSYTSNASARKKANIKRLGTMANPEAAGRWGVVVGKLLHSRVIDFTALKDKAIHKHRIASCRSEAMIGRLAASVQGRAGMVVAQARELCKKIAKETQDRLDSEWNDPGLLSYMFSTEYIDMLMLLATTARRVFATQPVLAVVQAPCRVFGDIHGQLRDLLLLFRAFGFPKREDNMSFVFNGDFVDRGKHQLAVLGLLLALKVEYPDKVWLIRGNHEDRLMNEKYGFRDECCRLIGEILGPKLFDLMENVFDQLPVACLISERIFVVHGGIGDGMWKLDDLRTVKRPLGAEALLKEENRWVFNMLWSDPIEDGKSYDPSVFGVHESPRGEVTSQFAWNITKMFCARNGLSLIVRSHQSKKGSRGFDVMHDNMLIRVFSARDYEGHGNDGAVLLIQPVSESEQQASGSGRQLVTVRPQVLRSVTKARQEAKRRAPAQMSEDDSGGSSIHSGSMSGQSGPVATASEEISKAAPAGRASAGKTRRSST